jgi:hypothetical protein
MSWKAGCGGRKQTVSVPDNARIQSTVEATKRSLANAINVRARTHSTVGDTSTDDSTQMQKQKQHSVCFCFLI